jgi:hypothetical protein
MGAKATRGDQPGTPDLVQRASHRITAHQTPKRDPGQRPARVDCTNGGLVGSGLSGTRCNSPPLLVLCEASLKS